MGNTPNRMTPADALVIFGVTGDLAHKMIFPALYAMARRGVLNVPVVGVAAPTWSPAQLRKQATDSIRQAGKIDDRGALGHLLSRPRCSPRLSKGSVPRVWPIRRGSSSKNRSDATWLRRGGSTASRCRYFRKTRSSA
jgi:hypothetical protein